MLRSMAFWCGCCCYRKGTNFQANHNSSGIWQIETWVVVATAKVQIFKQITTYWEVFGVTGKLLLLPQRYKFSSKSQLPAVRVRLFLVVATAKVQIFKQITTALKIAPFWFELLLLPQRYKFSSKSQLSNSYLGEIVVVVATAKVQIFKQITTLNGECIRWTGLLLLPQRYKFSSKSQLATGE